jgi:hypothetical protein
MVHAVRHLVQVEEVADDQPAGGQG